MLWDRDVFSVFAAALGYYPISRAVRQILAVRSLFSFVSPLSARETVATDTPQASATSFSLTILIAPV